MVMYAETPDQAPPAERVLDPIDRNSEILFGLFMALTFTGTLSVATAGAQDVRLMLIAALGCNIAWGFVDGVMFVLRAMVARGRQVALLEAIRNAASPAAGVQLLAKELSGLAEGIGAEGLERLRLWVMQAPKRADLSRSIQMRMEWQDLRGALGVFLLVVASTFPVALPFVFFDDLFIAMRVSGLVAICILFYCGFSWGVYAGVEKPRRVGVVMVLLGALIQAVVIALGG